METSNPVLGKNTFSQFGYLGRADLADRMTIQGTINKSLGLVVLATVAGVVSWVFIASNPAVGMGLITVSAIAAFVLALVAAFRPQNAPIVAPIYALAEGIVLGGVSLLYASASSGIVPLAIGLTISVLLVMLGLYRAGILRATPAFTRMIIVATGAVAVVYMVALGLTMFGLSMPGLWTPTPLGIGIQLVIVGIAALNFVIDFDFIERGSQQGAPKFMEWYGAFSLCVTLFWLYLEILRLLMLLNSRR
ncbi:MAG: Bax inhibitor-1/YccA family protein [Fimbriimonadaceae bacterium]